MCSLDIGWVLWVVLVEEGNLEDGEDGEEGEEGEGVLTGHGRVWPERV